MKFLAGVVVGIVVWHKFSRLAIRVLGAQDKIRADVFRKLDTEALTKMRKAAQEEEQRRRAALAGLN